MYIQCIYLGLDSANMCGVGVAYLIRLLPDVHSVGDREGMSIQPRGGQQTDRVSHQVQGRTHLLYLGSYVALGNWKGAWLIWNNCPLLTVNTVLRSLVSNQIVTLLRQPLKCTHQQNCSYTHAHCAHFLTSLLAVGVIQSTVVSFSHSLCTN